MAKVYNNANSFSPDANAKDTGNTSDAESFTRFDITDAEPENTDQETTDTDSEVEEGDEEVVEESNTQEDTPSQEESTSETSLGEITTELETMKQRYANAQQLIGKHSSELHQLRQFYAEHQQRQTQAPEEKGEILDEFIKDPRATLEKEFVRRQQLENQQRQIESQRIAQNTQYVDSQIPNKDTLNNLVLEIAKQDGIANPTMDMLNQSIQTDPVLAVSYYRRAQLLAELRETKTKGKKTIDTIAKNSRKPSQLNSNVSTSKQTFSYSDKELSSLSDAEFKALMKQYKL